MSFLDKAEKVWGVFNKVVDFALDQAGAKAAKNMDSDDEARQNATEIANMREIRFSKWLQGASLEELRKGLGNAKYRIHGETDDEDFGDWRITPRSKREKEDERRQQLVSRIEQLEVREKRGGK